jgi:hypothetical protein
VNGTFLRILPAMSFLFFKVLVYYICSPVFIFPSLEDLDGKRNMAISKIPKITDNLQCWLFAEERNRPAQQDEWQRLLPGEGLKTHTATVYGPLWKRLLIAKWSWKGFFFF